MITQVQNLFDEYISWLRDKTTLHEVGSWIRITTPHLDRHNDYIQIYIKKEKGKYLISDDGYTIGDLEISGCSLESPKRQALLKLTLNGFGISLNETRLEVFATDSDFPVKKHNLIQAILAVNDLFYLSRSIVTSVFYEDVEKWLDLNEIRYTPKIKFTGRTGFDYIFDFVIPKSKVKPERILKTINNPTKENAQALLLAWVDTKEVRSPDSIAYAIINDSEKSVSASIVDAFTSYGVRPIPWSRRELSSEELAA